MALRLAGAGDGGPSQMVDGVRMPTEISMRLVAELLPYARNSKKHDAAQVALIANSMKDVGFTNPLLIADGGILAGHGRLLAAQKLGLARVPCIDLSHLDADKRRALVIFDNRSQELGGGYDLESLKLETDYLRSAGFDLEAATGFAEDDLAELLAGIAEPDPPKGTGDADDVPPLPDEPVSVLGDVWRIGPDHRVMCGSSLEPADWDRLMAGELADVSWIDPPYNVDIGEKNKGMDRVDGGNRQKTGGIQNDKMTGKDFYQFLLSAFTALAGQMKPGAPIYVAHPEIEAINFRTAFRDAGFKQQGTVIWNKNQHVLGRLDHQCRTEPLIYGWLPGAAHKWYGGRKVNNVVDLGEDNPFTQMADGRWQVRFGDAVMVLAGDVQIEVHASDMLHEPKPSSSDLHPTVKPVALIARQLKNSARRGEVVADAFGGSGSTALAAHQLGMKSRLMELDPKYVDVIVRRMTAFTGLVATHAVTGAPFPEPGAARAPETNPIPTPVLALNEKDLF